MKTCSKCKVPKECSEFHKNRAQRDGLQPRCKLCVKTSRATDKDADGLTYNQRKTRPGADGLTYFQRRRHKTRAYARKKKYGLTTSDFDCLLSQQGGVCAICKEVGKRWDIDHNHSTGKVRAVLCHQCNVAIGFLKDSARLAAAATEYLTKHGCL